ncbi:PQQ-binding-like beta-propeller repeat protein [Halorussus lipolyticus]|uniref:outer membrane protein assembly factor BamB family protein n=1 Tax=Halorussus lipolyticus TaxID=3034024 RepID=UPI0023E816F9|nr:PQQ-binding-like beta-propeller repeat protein [Halorussus sp. DT80]
MVPRETGRRGFLLGAAGATGSAGTGHQSGFGAPAVGIPGLRDDHRVRWEFAVEDEEALVYPAASTDGAVFTLVNETHPDGEDGNAVHAIEMQTGETRWKNGETDLPVAASDRHGLVYTRHQAKVQALDVADGSVAWEFESGEKYFRAFAVAEDTAFVATGRELTALDADDGTERWQISVGPDPDDGTTGISAHIRGLTVTDDTLYFGSVEGFTAVSVADGERHWHVSVAGPSWVADVRDDLLVGWSNEAVYGIETADGNPRFRTPVGNLRTHGIGGTVGERAVYVWGDQLTAVDLRTGGKRWTYDATDDEDPGASDRRGFSPIVADGRVFTSTGDGSVVALDADSGRERWQFEGEATFGTWGTVVGEHVYVTGERHVHAFDAETGRETWSLEVHDVGTPIWVRSFAGTVFVGTRVGELSAIDPPSKLATAPVETASEFATSRPGLGLLGLLGAGLLGVGYRRAKRRASGGGLGTGSEVELGRLELLDSGPVTETHLKRVETSDGLGLVAETRLTDSASENPDLRHEFSEAIEEWAGLDTDRPGCGLLPVLDFGTDPDPWFRTPYLAGGSLSDSWPLDYRERVEVASGVARTLHAGHREEVTHGWLAPRHVLRKAGDPDPERRFGTGVPEVRVGGWFVSDALAEARDESAPDPYAPPESRGESATREQSVSGDVYRVGALAHHLLTGEVSGPGSGEADSTTDLPRDLEAVLSRALADDPADRYDSALAFDDEFRWAALDR